MAHFWFSADPFFSSSVAQIIDPWNAGCDSAIYAPRVSMAEAGGIMSYGADVKDAVSQSRQYMSAEFFKGAKPADLPVAAADQVRADCQPQDCQIARINHHRSLLATRRRGDRVTRHGFNVPSVWIEVLAPEWASDLVPTR